MEPDKLGNMEIRRRNRSRIYRYLYKKGAVSRHELSLALDMSLPTVTQNLRELEEDGLVEPGEVLASTGGRRAQTVCCKRGARYAIGLDITYSHVGGVLLDLMGGVVKNRYIDMRFSNQPAYFQAVSEFVGQLLADQRIEPEKILGVGIALPATVTMDGLAVEASPVLDFAGGTAAQFSQHLHYPCVLCNDAQAAGSAEVRDADGALDDLAYLSLNRAVGGAVFQRGRLYRGLHNRGGAFGHMTIFPEGSRCVCGRRGCLNAYCSENVLADSAGGKLDNFFTNLERGSQRHQKLWRDYVRCLAVAVNNLHVLFDCDVMLGGHVGTYLDDYLEEIRAAVAHRGAYLENAGFLRICSYKLGGAAVGAALWFVEPFIDSV